jgi:mannose-6-phosphate isomerase-like protein (cupin superfamily)
MKHERLYCVNEDEAEKFKVSREGASGYLILGRLSDPEKTGTQAAIVCAAEAPPHQDQPIPLHFHRDYEETMYLLQGRGVFRVGPTSDAIQSMPIRPGSCCYVPAGYLHQMLVEGDEPIKMICSYFCATGKGGKSHQEISVELTSLPLKGEYGKTPVH